jgi:hypothetical protein
MMMMFMMVRFLNFRICIFGKYSIYQSSVKKSGSSLANQGSPSLSTATNQESHREHMTAVANEESSSQSVGPGLAGHKCWLGSAVMMMR